MRDKAVDEVTNALFPLAAEVILTAPAQPRALNPESLAEVVEHTNLRMAPALSDALLMARENPMTTFITGSLFLVGEAEAALELSAAAGRCGSARALRLSCSTHPVLPDSH